MAYSAPTSDFVTTALNGAIVAADVTATIGTGLDLPAANGIIQIDYDSITAVGLANGPETIAYATYTAGTGALAGITRGLNGTTGVDHEDGASVQCAPSASYWGSASIVAADLATDAVETAKIKDANVTQAKLATTAGNGPLKSKIITGTRDAAAATGDVAYTGVGFISSKIHCIAQVDNTLYRSDGAADSTKTGTCVYQSAANVFWQGVGLAIYSNQSSWAQTAVVKSYDADGFTLTWSKTGTPAAGTFKLIFICER